MGASNENSLRISENGRLFSFKEKSKRLFNLVREKAGNRLFAFKKGGAEAGNIFTNIFKKQAGPGKDDVMESVLKTEEPEKKKPLLGPLPKIDTSLFIDEEYRATRRLSFARGAFATAVMIALFVFGYFYAQLTPDFNYLGTNAAQTLIDKTNDLVNIQTRLNANRHRIVKAKLDNFTYYADEFLKKHNELIGTKDEYRKQELDSELAALQERLKKDFDAIKANLSEVNYVAIYRDEEVTPEEASGEFNALLREHFEKEKAEAAKKESVIAKTEIKELNEIISLIGNEEFEEIFDKYDFGGAANENISLITSINNVTRNELSILHALTDKKISWADIIREIERITRDVDRFYGSGYFEDIGGIAYTAYDFDAATNRISITGETKRDDATNFTLIANLIDKFEASPIFKDINMRSFTKSGSLEAGYTATLKLDFFLQTDEESEADEKPNPTEVPDELFEE